MHRNIVAEHLPRTQWPQSQLGRKRLSKKKPKGTPYLQIQLVPVAQRLNPRSNAYILVILPHGIRAAGGQYTAEEAHEIANAVKEWDWGLDPDERPYCLPELEALLDSICNRFAVGGAK